MLHSAWMRFLCLVNWKNIGGNMAYFDGIKVGDQVYDMAHGWGRVNKIESGLMLVDFCTMAGWYSPDGSISGGYYRQTIFWDKPVFDPPQRPKRKVKKTIERWVNAYFNGGHYITWDTKEDADKAARSGRIACVKLIGEYEVEE